MQNFKLIVAGGRDFNDYERLSKTLFAMSDNEFADYEIVIVSGMARGADALGHRFAKEHSVVCHEFPANWEKNGKSAGHKRNREMGDFADGVLAFWDGKSVGTAGMIDYMHRLKKPVFVVGYGDAGA